MNGTVTSIDYALSIIRNPYGFDEDTQRWARLKIADAYEELVKTSSLEIEKLCDEIKKRDKCAFIGAMRDCPTHGESAEIKRLQKLATCECGDEFTEHDPGTCANCLIPPNVELTGSL